MDIDTQQDARIFESKWFELAEIVCQRIFQQPEIQTMRERFKQGSHLTDEEKSNFISVANKVKYEVIHEKFGNPGTEEFDKFREAWKHWFNHKPGTSVQLNGRRLTNAEHIVYSSTPDPEEFLSNFK